MSNRQVLAADERGGPNLESPEPPQAAVFEVLSNERRRHVLRAIREEESIDIGPLAVRVAARENGTSVGEVTYDQRKRAYTALQQSHLPKMDEAGALRFDKDRGTVESVAETATFDLYLEVVPQAHRTSSEFYLALAVGTLVVNALVAAGVHLFGTVSSLAWAAVVVALFGVTALGQLYRTADRSPRAPGDEP